MNFRPELAEKVIAGEKTETRRALSANERSPWFHGRCAFKKGRDYAVCPGRGKYAIGRIRITEEPVQQRLGELTLEAAQREGFKDAQAFFDYYRDLHGELDKTQVVWVVRFEAVS